MSTSPLQLDQRAHNRRDILLDAAAALFRERGFHAASIRDIAKSTGILPGSVYYHFTSKEALLLAVYEEGVRRIADKVALATGDPDQQIWPDNWTRLEAAATAHLEALLEGGDYSQVVIRVLPEDVPDIAAELTHLRDAYEAQWRALTTNLTPAPRGGEEAFRHLLLGAMNWARVWYRPRQNLDQKTHGPADIARSFINMLKP